MSCLPRLKTLLVNSVRLAISKRAISIGLLQQHQTNRYLLHRRTISEISSSGILQNNIISSRHEDCLLQNETVVQHFFERASLWPNLVAVVQIYLIKTLVCEIDFIVCLVL